MNKILIIFILLIIPCSSIFAHPGRTNANGCHTNKETGEYHCHTDSNKIIRTEARVSANTESRGIFGQCGSKIYCKEMNSCEEAKYFLSNCNLIRLDGDNDGIPCESICK